MGLRDSESVSSVVSEMRAELEELKTKQPTSQTSGMTFSSVGPDRYVIEVPEETSPLRLTIVRLVTGFTSFEQRATLVIPTIRIASPGYDVEEIINQNFIDRKRLIFKKDGVEQFNVDYSPLEHRAPTPYGSYDWVSILGFAGEHPALTLHVYFSTKNSAPGRIACAFNVWQDV